MEIAQIGAADNHQTDVTITNDFIQVHFNKGKIDEKKALNIMAYLNETGRARPGDFVLFTSNEDLRPLIVGVHPLGFSKITGAQ
jgi:hypothetical protein